MWILTDAGYGSTMLCVMERCLLEARAFKEPDREAFVTAIAEYSRHLGVKAHCFLTFEMTHYIIAHYISLRGFYEDLVATPRIVYI